MSGLAHEHRNGRTFSVRQWREVRADNAAALMSCYGLGGWHEAAEDHCAGSFRVAFGFSVSSTQPKGRRRGARQTRVRPFIASST